MAVLYVLILFPVSDVLSRIAVTIFVYFDVFVIVYVVNMFMTGWIIYALLIVPCQNEKGTIFAPSVSFQDIKLI